jgi:hypothetical protein
MGNPQSNPACDLLGLAAACIPGSNLGTATHCVKG